MATIVVYAYCDRTVPLAQMAVIPASGQTFSLLGRTLAQKAYAGIHAAQIGRCAATGMVCHLLRRAFGQNKPTFPATFWAFTLPPTRGNARTWFQ